ncbi:hypothetical protein KFK09_028175 [Dendrobium nobile]|uniref:Uncharacterized protein n=1 Tax=Dendrobium nobile TaxID=94219 RepID=A0A8T3A1Z8_DENNO|nr:hypothetical protein KFK09_028175 [Dendrobium nobile]
MLDLLCSRLRLQVRLESEKDCETVSACKREGYIVTNGSEESWKEIGRRIARSSAFDVEETLHY